MTGRYDGVTTPGSEPGRRRQRRHLRRRQPRQHLVAHRELIQRRRDRDRRRLHIVFDDALVGVEVRVVRVGVVLDRILAEADARQPGVVERRAVGAADRRGCVVADAPTTPRSSNGASASRTTAAAAGGPNTPAPRARPVPESMLK